MKWKEQNPNHFTLIMWPNQSINRDHCDQTEIKKLDHYNPIHSKSLS